MATWLMKSEPESFSWSDLARDGKTAWDGVRNHQAANYLRAMKRGDKALFYHSGAERAVVGMMTVSGEHRPDPSDPSGRFVMVEMRPLKAAKRPLTLAEIKSESRFKDLLLVRHSRLSVMPVGAAHWALLCRLAGFEP